MTVTLHERRLFLQMLAATAASAGVSPRRRAPVRQRARRSSKRRRTKTASSGTITTTVTPRKAILAAFKRAYPFVKKAEFVDVPSAQKTAKIIQESMAGGPTADVLLNDATVQKSLAERGLVLETDWAALGVATSAVMTPSPDMILALTPPFVVLYNTDLVKEADVPRSWDDAFDAKWKGHTGHWMRASFFVDLSAALGEAKVRELAARLAALQPRMFDGLFPLSQAVGSGEISLAVTAYDSAVRIVEKGAPVKMIGLDPTPFGMICGGILKYGRNPNTARLFLAWLASPEGAITFEKMTKRGNFFVAGTETQKLLKDRKVSYFTAEQSIAQAKKLNALEAEFSRKLAGR